MARLLGVALPDDKRADYALTLIFGIGWTKSKEILNQSGVNASTRVGKLSEEELKKIIGIIEKNHKIEGDLREELMDNMKRKREIGSYAGLRNAKGLPSRGQRTKSNARTKRGKRRTVGALKKEVWAKLEQNQPAAAKPKA